MTRPTYYRVGGIALDKSVKSTFSAWGKLMAADG